MRDHAEEAYRPGRRRRTAPKVVRAIRALVEGSTRPVRQIAAEVGVSPNTVHRLKVRHKWVRPRATRVPLAGQRGGGHPIVPEAVEAARALIEGTALTYTAISERTGISRAALCRWRKERGWQRPPDAPTFLPGPRADGRSRPTRYRTIRGQPLAADAVGQAEVLLTTTLLSQAEIAKRIGVSAAWVGTILRRRGWQRPLPRPGSKRFAASVRTGSLKTEGDRRGRPYDPSVRSEARDLWEGTLLSTMTIGARLGAHPGTIARWAKEGGWEPPPGRLGREQLRFIFGRLHPRRPAQAAAVPRIRF